MSRLASAGGMKEAILLHEINFETRHVSYRLLTKAFNHSLDAFGFIIEDLGGFRVTQNAIAGWQGSCTSKNAAAR